jgi:high-affinity iron transporter
MLLASVVLFSVSYWLISKAEAQKWVAYIKDKVGGSLSSNSLRAVVCRISGRLPRRR